MNIKAKLRPFYVAKMLYEQTDEDHYLTIAQIMEQLEKEYGISTSRGTVGDDIKALQELGIEIEVIPSTQKRFSFIGRRFDLPELKTLLVEPLLAQRYDFIVATYSLHHLPDEQKVSFLRVLQDHLNPGGQILIGDVAFENRSQLEQCRKDMGDEWDDDEIYFVVDELKGEFPELGFKQISHCSGVLSIPARI